jgi:hydroxymethylpyrimidine/phosphomethylpyrimidine kinase
MNERAPRPRALTIAGSDSGGGAGIQADLKTFSALGAFGMTAITAVTVQNTKGVARYEELPASIVADQIRAVAGDIGVDAAKTGMLYSARIIETVADFLAERSVPLVVDPVMVAKGGARLIDPDALEALKRLLIARADIATPNLPEAQLLSGIPIGNTSDMRAAGEALLPLGCRAVLVKGGHLLGETVSDVLVTSGDVRIWESPRVATRHTHGTGCTLASAIAAGLAQGLDVVGAVDRARAYVQRAIASAPGLGRGHGPLDHAHPLRSPAGSGG